MHGAQLLHIFRCVVAIRPQACDLLKRMSLTNNHIAIQDNKVTYKVK